MPMVKMGTEAFMMIASRRLSNKPGPAPGAEGRIDVMPGSRILSPSPAA